MSVCEGSSDGACGPDTCGPPRQAPLPPLPAPPHPPPLPEGHAVLLLPPVWAGAKARQKRKQQPRRVHGTSQVWGAGGIETWLGGMTHICRHAMRAGQWLSVCLFLWCCVGMQAANSREDEDEDFGLDDSIDNVEMRGVGKGPGKGRQAGGKVRAGDDTCCQRMRRACKMLCRTLGTPYLTTHDKPLLVYAGLTWVASRGCACVVRGLGRVGVSCLTGRVLSAPSQGPHTHPKLLLLPCLPCLH